MLNTVVVVILGRSEFDRDTVGGKGSEMMHTCLLWDAPMISLEYITHLSRFHSLAVRACLYKMGYN